MAKPRVLITTPFIQPGDEGDARLREAGFETLFNQWHGGRTEEEMIDILQGIDAALVSTDPFTRKVFEGVPQLKVIARTGVGYDAVDVKAATDHGVAVCLAAGCNTAAVAEFAFALMIACSRKLRENLEEVRRGGWVRHQERGLEGSTLGIVGLGGIGKEVAKRARAFEMNVVACDTVRDEEFARQHQISYLPLEQLLRESDYVSLHVLLDESTRHLINAERLALMKPTAYLINTSRGGVVDTAALCEALKEKRLAGAGLDVFEEEPLGTDSPLRAMDNVYLTAHVSGSSTRSRHTSMMMSTENIIRVLRGEKPLHVVNPEVLA
ncbi:MAG: phosphoglycerate dehydrogenase [Chloroflexota bacterium]